MQIATIVPIMLTVGTNRIVPGIAIPHPGGNPALGPSDKAIRKYMLFQGIDNTCNRADDF